MMTRKFHWLFLPLLVLTLLVTGPARSSTAAFQEVPEVPDGKDDTGDLGDTGDLDDLDDLGAELDFSFSYLHFNDLDMDRTYSYLPTFRAGLSYRIAPQVRTFLALGFGQKSGDPYYGVPGFDGSQEITVTTVPFIIGLKYNLARNAKIRVQAGFALMLAYTREHGVTQFDDYGRLNNSAASNILGGYQMTFAPEWLIRGDSRIVGLEIGYGGTKGTLNGDAHSHDIDLIGLSGRVYFVFGL